MSTTPDIETDTIPLTFFSGDGTVYVSLYVADTIPYKIEPGLDARLRSRIKISVDDCRKLEYLSVDAAADLWLLRHGDDLVELLPMMRVDADLALLLVLSDARLLDVYYDMRLFAPVASLKEAA